MSEKKTPAPTKGTQESPRPRRMDEIPPPAILEELRKAISQMQRQITYSPCTTL